MAFMIARDEAVRAALQRMLASKYFAQSGSLSNLLRYLVEETLAGRGAALKEYNVGCEVFGRGASFDPKTDGIVRVQASRLRGKLRDYYSAEGKNDEVVISVPTGAYTAEFLPNGKSHTPAPASPWPRRLAWTGAVAVLATGVFLLGRSMWKTGSPLIESVAVLPFRNLTGNPAQDYLADGLTDTLINDLGKVPAVRVISRTTAMSFAGTTKSLGDVARELKVDALVEGSMTRAGENVRVNVNLVEARQRERNLWSRTLEHGVRNFAGLQGELSREITRQLQPGVPLAPANSKTPDPDAYAAYLKGRHLAGQGTELGQRQALDWYGKAMALDPQLALAKAGQAHAYIFLSDFFMSPAEALPQAKIAAVQAVQIDPSLSDAFAAQGAAALFNDRDAQAAETDLRQALKLNPNSAQALTTFAALCGSMGRFDEAIAAARRAVQLDPLSPNAHSWLQWILLVAGRYQEVEQVGQNALQLFPGSTLSQLWTGASLAMRGDHTKAAPYFEKASQQDQIPMVPLFLGLMQALKNDKVGAQAQLAKAHQIGKRRYVCAYEVASLHSALGEMDEAYRWMERGLGEKCLCFTWLMTEPWMKKFREDPRFPALAAKVGLWSKARSL